MCVWGGGPGHWLPASTGGGAAEARGGVLQGWGAIPVWSLGLSESRDVHRWWRAACSVRVQ